MKRYKIIQNLLIVLILSLSNMVCAQKNKQECKRKLIHELKIEKTNYYRNTIFNLPLEELKHYTKNYFEDKKNIKYQNETLNKICYRTYDYTNRSETYTSDQYGNVYASVIPSQKLHVILYLNFFRCDDNTFALESEVYSGTILDAKASVRENFKLNDLLLYLNKNINSTWKPSQALKIKIEQYNKSRKRNCRKIRIEKYP